MSRSRFLLPFLCAGFLLSAHSAFAFCTPNGLCEVNETPLNCPADCGPVIPTNCDTCTHGSCSLPAPGVNNDADQLSDRLEYQLAHQVFPNIFLQWAVTDRDVSYLFKGFPIPYTAKFHLGHNACLNPGHCIEIRYGIAYTKDCGDLGGLNPGGCSTNSGFLGIHGGHVGDSELAAVLVHSNIAYSTNPADWKIAAVYASQHTSFEIKHFLTCSSGSVNCYALSQNQCLNTPGCDWEFNGFGSLSVCTHDPTEISQVCQTSQTSRDSLYAAEGKHAMYFSDGDCDSGGFLGFDHCPTNQYNMRNVKDGLLQNIGSRYTHSNFDTTIADPLFNCVGLDVWTATSFRDSTSYKTNFTKPIVWGY